MTSDLSRARSPRRAVLLVLAATDILFGIALWNAARYPGVVYWWPAATGEVLGIPLQACAMVWLAVGVVLITGAFTPTDTPHYSLAVLIKTWWAAGATYWWFAASGVSPGSWGIAVTYGGFAMVVILCASWPETPVLVTQPKELK